MKRKIYIIPVLIIAYIAAALITLPRTDDEARLQAITDNSAKTAQNGEAAGIISHLSNDYEDNEGRNFKTMRLFIINTIYSEKNNEYTITTKTNRVEIKGDRASMNIEGTAEFPSTQRIYSAVFNIEFKKAPYRHMFIIPNYRWKITSIN